MLRVQIEKEVQLVLGAYDNFHPDCIVPWPPQVPETLLEELEEPLARSVKRFVSLRPTSGLSPLRRAPHLF